MKKRKAKAIAAIQKAFAEGLLGTPEERLAKLEAQVRELERLVKTGA